VYILLSTVPLGPMKASFTRNLFVSVSTVFQSSLHLARSCVAMTRRKKKKEKKKTYMAVKGGAGSAPPNGTVTGPNWS